MHDEELLEETLPGYNVAPVSSPNKPSVWCEGVQSQYNHRGIKLET